MFAPSVHLLSLGLLSLGLAAPPRGGRPAMHTPPHEYVRVLRLLRAAASSGRWPPTTGARARVLHGCGQRGLSGGATFTLANPAELASGSRAPRANAAFPQLARAVFELESALAPEQRPPSAQCAVSCNATFLPHLSPPSAEGAPSMIVGLGNYRGGDAVVDGDPSTRQSIRYSPLLFDASSRAHWTLPVKGECFTLCWFSPAGPYGATALESYAAQLAAELTPPLTYRPRSTDANVLCELLGGRSAYAGPPRGDPRWPEHLDFSPSGHVVLDVGAQIGVFSRMALKDGAVRVIAVEPEPKNAALCRRNLGLCDGCIIAESSLERHLMDESCGTDDTGIAEVVEAAVASGDSGTAQLVLGKPRSDGVLNTWRHALDGSSHYAEGGDKVLERVTVMTRPFFGSGGLLSDDVSFVKLDCEGCELDLLTSFSRGEWRRVQRLIFEWSFTKERRISVFLSVVRSLEAEGFQVHYEGRGQWESLREWPWKMDAVVFAAR